MSQPCIKLVSENHSDDIVDSHHTHIYLGKEKDQSLGAQSKH